MSHQQQLLGMVPNFCHSSQLQLLNQCDNAIHKVKGLICTVPVLSYFNPAIELTLHCDHDASRSGLEYALLQQGQPIAFGACGMTKVEGKYIYMHRNASDFV